MPVNVFTAPWETLWLGKSIQIEEFRKPVYVNGGFLHIIPGRDGRNGNPGARRGRIGRGCGFPCNTLLTMAVLVQCPGISRRLMSSPVGYSLRSYPTLTEPPFLPISRAAPLISVSLATGNCRLMFLQRHGKRSDWVNLYKLRSSGNPCT